MLKKRKFSVRSLELAGYIMETGMVKETVIFMHLHRTGGTTFSKSLDNIYEPGEIYTIEGKRFIESSQDFIRQPAERREKYRLIKGHLFWGLHKFCPNGAKYITILRQPLERVMSQYYWHLRPECLFPIPPGMTLAEFLESGRFISTDNGMTRLIAGKDQEDVEYGKCSQDVLELAKNNLQQYFLTSGITEHYDESLIIFKRLLGWKKYPFYQKKNVHYQKPTHPELSKREQDVLLKYNHYDIEIYEFAKKMFADSIRQMGESFQDEVASFKRLNNFPQRRE